MLTNLLLLMLGASLLLLGLPLKKEKPIKVRSHKASVRHDHFKK